ncbi:MAG: hypothetical protein ABGZ17_07565, partial [Planctomycetaceae bacterium]
AEDITTLLPPGAAAGGGFGGGARRALEGNVQRFNAPAANRDAQAAKVTAAKDLAELRRDAGKRGVAAYEEQLDRVLRRAGSKVSSLAVVRYIGNRTFYKRGAEWHESQFNPSQHKKIKSVKVGSDQYLQLLNRDVRLAKYLALGNVVLRVNKEWYRIHATVKRKS